MRQVYELRIGTAPVVFRWYDIDYFRRFVLPWVDPQTDKYYLVYEDELPPGTRITYAHGRCRSSGW